MPFPANPNVGDTYVENNNTYKYMGPTNGWYRTEVRPTNDTTYIGSDGAPGGSSGDTQVLFNRSGALASDAGLTYNSTTDALAAGRLLVGTKTSRNVGGAERVAQIEGTSGTTTNLSVARNSNDSSEASLNLGKSRSTSVGGFGIVQENDRIGSLSFWGADGNALLSAGAIVCQVDGVPNLNDMPGRIVMSTTSSGASSPTERLRIDKNGSTMVGTTSVNGAGGLTFRPNITEGSPQIVFNRNTTTNTSFCVLFKNAGTDSGSISYTNSAVAYNTASDYRLKENVVPLTGAIDRVNQLQIHRFNFIADPDKTVDGFIAHEAQAVVPECVTGEKDAVDNEGNPIYQGIDQAKLVPLLTAALQEAIAKIETLAAKVATLEAQ